MGLTVSKTHVGGVLVIDSDSGERATILVDKHALSYDLPRGWRATYYGPKDVKAAEIRLQVVRQSA